MAPQIDHQIATSCVSTGCPAFQAVAAAVVGQTCRLQGPPTRDLFWPGMARFQEDSWGTRPGTNTKNDGKSQFFMGRSTISTGPYSIAILTSPEGRLLAGIDRLEQPIVASKVIKSKLSSSGNKGTNRICIYNYLYIYIYICIYIYTPPLKTVFLLRLGSIMF